MLKERWRDIPGYEGRYQASTAGRVRSVDNYVRCGKGGKGLRLVKGRVLRDGPMGKYGHRCVVLGKGNTVGVHVAVAAAWLGPRPEGLDVAHRNCTGGDNRVCNLRYASRSDNNLDQVPAGKRLVTLEDIKRLRACSSRQETFPIAEALGISYSYANNIRLLFDATNR